MKFSETGQWFAKKLSVVRWIRAYNKKLFKGDILGGITVGIMLIPQSMAYAVLAGVPPVYGLYASVVPLLIYPLFTTTRHVFYGVIAVDMIIVSTSVGLIASPGSSHYIMLVIVLAGMVGLIQIAMSVARLGFIINLLSKPVITGFALAAPIIIILSQLDNLLGLKTGQKTHIYGMIADYIHKIGGIHLIPALFGVGSIIFLIIIRRFFPSFPKSLLLIIAASLIVWLVSFPAHTLAIVGKVPKGISHFKAPSFTLDDLRRLFPTAITLALIQFMDVTSVSRTLESNKAGTIKPNRELFAMGIGNLSSSFFRGIPVSGSFSRSAVGRQAGAKTPLANIASAVVIIIALLFLTPLLFYIPMPAFAAIIIVSAIGIIDIKAVKYLFKTKERDGYIAVFTCAAMLIIGIQEGILLGIVASLIGVLIRNSRPNIAELGQVDNTSTFRDLTRFPNAKRVEGLLIIRVDAGFSFNNAEYLKKYILKKSDEGKRKITHVIIDGRSINDLDTTALDALQSIFEILQKEDIELHLAGVKGPVRDVMLRSGFAREMGGKRFHLTVDEAVIYILARARKEDSNDQRLKDYKIRAES